MEISFDDMLDGLKVVLLDRIVQEADVERGFKTD